MLEARIVDFWRGSFEQRHALATWLRHLGVASPIITDNGAQIGPACGYVAAHALNLMKTPPGAGETWATVDVSAAAARQVITAGNAVLGKGARMDSHGEWLTEHDPDFLETQDVFLLTQYGWEAHAPHEAAAAEWNEQQHVQPCQSWPLAVGSRDWIARSVASELREYARAGRRADAPRLLYFVMNTHNSSGQGSHWITLVLSMRWV